MQLAAFGDRGFCRNGRRHLQWWIAVLRDLLPDAFGPGQVKAHF